MADEIKKNLVFLIKNLGSLPEVLVELIEKNVISEYEQQEIEAEKIPFDKNKKLLQIIQTKDWLSKKSIFLDILRKTNNNFCAEQIEGQSTSSSPSKRNLIRHQKISSQNGWWPEKKMLIKSLHRRKYGNRFLVEELHERLSQTEVEKRIVICESPAAWKYSGMGGMGKTLTAKWYANEYENEYDHILWIDCGEGSLLKSFESLSRDLKIENLEKLDSKEMARKSFDELARFRCLWIYDNAENYLGKDGIINFLPQNQQNFYCIITSRSREWGSKNGLGKISDLELDIFSDEESLDFLKEVLDESINRPDHLLKELCHSLGNLPLALQLAVATLNDGKIDLKSYIQKNKFEKVIDAPFDDYERTINGNVKISLELIMKEDGGKEANDLLLIFGYIRPDDVEVEFFKKVLGFEDEKVKAAIKILKKYSLVAKRKITTEDETKIVLSIHRLLQQVIRHNGRETEKEMLRKILGCPGFIDYKLLPFTKYANAEIHKEFPKVKVELFDQEQLTKLIRKERFEDSVRLSKFISEELQTNTSIFNYAICLAKNEHLEESVDVLEKLEKEKMKKGNIDVMLGILSLKEEVSRDLVHLHLFALYGRLDKKERMQKLLEKRKLFQFVYSSESLGILSRILNSDLTQSNYSLEKGPFTSTMTFKLGTESKEIEINGYISKPSLNISCLPRTIQKLDLWATEVVCTGEIDLPNLNYLKLGRMNDCSVLSSFHSANITHIHFNMIEEVNVDILPKSVTHIKITTDTKKIIVGGVRRVDKLILDYLSLSVIPELQALLNLQTETTPSHLEKVLSHLQTDELVLFSERIRPKVLIELTKKEIKRIAVGRVEWGWWGDFSILSSHVDRKAVFYLWEGEKGRGIGEQELLEYLKLY